MRVVAAVGWVSGGSHEQCGWCWLPSPYLHPKGWVPLLEENKELWHSQPCKQSAANPSEGRDVPPALPTNAQRKSWALCRSAAFLGPLLLPFSLSKSHQLDGDLE